jgi:hypothetical protein
MSFWSGGRRESSNLTDQSDILQTTDDGLGISGMAYRGQDRPRPIFDQVLQDLSMDQDMFEEAVDVFEPSTTDTTLTAESSPEQHPVAGHSGIPASAARPIPERPKHFDSPMKLSVNEKDGVIDVDIPLPDFGSPLQSPLLGGYPYASSQHGSSFGESSILSAPAYEPEQPANVAGWLSEFHPDFAVQAIKPYENLERDIKRAMSAEPSPMPSTVTPTLEQGPQERWIDVCSALVADTRSFSIKCIRLRRLVRLIPTPTYNQTAATPGVSGVHGRSQYGNPYTAGGNGPMMAEVHLEERFTEEPVMDFDATLVDAIDRVLGQSGQSSRAQSASSSRSSSRRGRRDTRTSSDVGHNTEVLPTDCKAVIFEALDTVVKNVTAERSPKDESSTSSSGPQQKKSSKDTLATAKTSADSSLKEGIRHWLDEVE